MYAFPEMIDMGLQEGQKWTSSAHKQVASSIGLCNSNVTTRDCLTDIVQSILKVPQERIKLITIRELYNEFGCPQVW